MHFSSFDGAYKYLLREVLREPPRASPRGLLTRELLDVMWSLSDPKKCKIDFTTTQVPERQIIYDEYVQKELEWYKSGGLIASQAPSKFWSKLADKHGHIVSNYGHMILHDKKYPEGFTAFQSVLDALVRDQDSRQAVLHYSEPRHHWVGNKDVPCTLCAHVMIRHEALRMHVFQRSCDLHYGLPYDVPWHSWVMQELVLSLKHVFPELRLGIFTHTCVSLHLYEKDRKLAEKICVPVYSEPSNSSLRHD